MRSKKLVFALLVFCLVSAPVLPKELLSPEHYVDKGACPFEGCTYRKWTVTTKTAFYKNPDVNSAIIFQAEKGETVNGLTGIVITLEPGQARTIKPIVLGKNKEISLKAGDVVYVLNYVGEGYYKFWFNGHIAVDQIGLPTAENGSDKIYNPEGIFDPER